MVRSNYFGICFLRVSLPTVSKSVVRQLSATRAKLSCGFLVSNLEPVSKRVFRHTHPRQKQEIISKFDTMAWLDSALPAWIPPRIDYD